MPETSIIVDVNNNSIKINCIKYKNKTKLFDITLKILLA